MDRILLKFEKQENNIVTMVRIKRSENSCSSKKHFVFLANELKTKKVVVKDYHNYAELRSWDGALHVEVCWLNRSDNKIFDGVVEHFDLLHQRLLDFFGSDQTEWQCLSLPEQKPTQFIFKNQSTIARLRRQNKVIYNKLFRFLWQHFLGCQVTIWDDYLPWSFGFDCIASNGFRMNGGIILNNYPKQGDLADAYYSIHT